MTEKSRLVTMKIANLIFFLGVLILNGLANALPIGGITTGEVSDRFGTLFAPAGITFSIWGIIYLLLLLFCLYSLTGIGRTDRPRDELIRRISVLFILSCVFNMLWILAWHHLQILLSFFLMLLLLASLLMIYLRLRKDGDVRGLAVVDKILVFIPFSIYLGWITVATIANTAVVLVKYRWDGWGISPVVWTVAVIVAAILIGIINLWRERDIFFALVLMWALIGIIIKRGMVEPVYTVIIWTAGIGISMLAVLIIFTAISRRQPA